MVGFENCLIKRPDPRKAGKINIAHVRDLKRRLVSPFDEKFLDNDWGTGQKKIISKKGKTW